MTHLLAATGGEFVCHASSLISSQACAETTGLVLDTSPYGDCQITDPDWSLWTGEIILALVSPNNEI